MSSVMAISAVSLGLRPGAGAEGVRGVWLFSHIALSFAGMATFATAAAAGAMYLVERRELKSRRFGAVFRVFPPLDTLDRVNHLAAIASWLALAVGIVLAATYSVAYQQLNLAQLVWGTFAWMAVSWIALGRILSGWQARRAALYSSVSFVAVVLLYVAFRMSLTGTGQFL
jgi:HemX protein